MEGDDASNLNSGKFVETLKGEASMLAPLTQVKKIEMMDKNRSVIILGLEEKVLTEVVEEKIAASLWEKLESMYTTKSLCHCWVRNNKSAHS